MRSQRRADEAKTIVNDLISAGWGKEQIARETGVSLRTVYRWITEGRAPHPVLLGALRGMAQQQGVYNADREGNG